MKPTTKLKTNPPKQGSKLDTLVRVLIHQGGTILALSTDLSWLPHTTRAALTRLKQRGYKVERTFAEGSAEAIYRIKIKPAEKALKA